MSTVSGEDSVRFNPAPSRLRPGHQGRRRVVACRYGHIIPERERYILPWLDWHCRECGTRWRSWDWLCAPVLQEAREWLVWSWRKVKQCWRPK
jgi:hypothetical protein